MHRKSFSISSRTAPAFLLLVIGLAFGPLLTRLGFYWDDWAKILVARLWGLKDYFAYYAGDRPLSAWTHILFTPLLGQTPLPWHIFTLLLRWLSAWGMWWSLNGLWPRAKRLNLIAALLFALWPAFVSEPAAVTFHQQWLQYALFFGSLGAMIYASRLRFSTTGPAPRKFYILSGLALAGMALQFSVTEYFVPLELVRPLVLWFLVGNLAAEQGLARPGFFTRLWSTAKAWLPYLLLTGGYAFYRLFIMRLPDADPYRANTLFDLLSKPLATLQQLGATILEDLAHILVSVWSEPLAVQFIKATPATLFSYAVAIAAAGLVIAYVALLREPVPAPAVEDATSSSVSAPRAEPWVPQALLLGVAAVLLGPVPAWITGRMIVFDFHSDRYAMPAMFGAGLLCAGLIGWLAQRRVQRGVLAGVLVALAVVLHLRVANDYRWLWASEQDFFWQLSWRAPGLQAPTALFILDEPFPNQGLFSTSAALNLLYPQPPGWGAHALPNQPDGVHNLAYWMYTIQPRYNHAPDSYTIALDSQFRTLRFSGQTPDNSLLLYTDLSQGSCLRVLSARDKLAPHLPELVKTFIPISNLERIQAQPLRAGYPPTSLIGANPGHPWCYFFEKADLARQSEDWSAVAQLYDQALAKGFSIEKTGSESPYEWLPFIEGLDHAGREAEAAELTRLAYQHDPAYQAMLCAIWNGAASGPVRGELGCKLPG